MGFLGDFNSDVARRGESAHIRDLQRQRINEQYQESWSVLDDAQTALRLSAAAGESEASHIIPRSARGKYDIRIVSPWQHIVDEESGLLVVRLNGRHQHGMAKSGNYNRDTVELEAQDIITGNAHVLGSIVRSKGGFVDFGVMVWRRGGRSRIEPQSEEAKTLYGLIRAVTSEISS